MQAASFYTLREACQKLNIHHRRLAAMVEDGLIPLRPGWGQYWSFLFPRDFIDGLAQDMALMRRFGSGHMTKGVFTLFYAHFTLRARPPGLSLRKQKAYSAPLRKLCEDAVVAGDLVTLATLQEMLAPYTQPSTVERWGSSGKIVTHRIGWVRYAASQHARRLQKLLLYPTASLAADLLGISSTTLIRQVRGGLRTGYQDPGGTWRVELTDLDLVGLDLSPASTLSVTEFAVALGESESWIIKRIHRGEITAYGESIYRRIPLIELNRLQKQRSTLNEGFEWLQELLEHTSSPQATWWPHDICRELHLVKSQVSIWAAEGLFPYFVMSRGAKGGEIRCYLRDYIVGLKNAIGDLSLEPAKKRMIATAYLQKCRDAKQIV